MGKASGHPVRWSMIVSMCLLPEVEVLQSVTRSIAILIKGFGQGSLSSAGGIAEPLLCHICRGHNLLCISWCPYSYLSNSTGIWLSSTYNCFPGVPSLSWASTRMVNFHDLGMTKAKNCLPASDTCLYSNPLTCVKVVWFMDVELLPFNRHLEMHLQKGSVHCIWSRASRQILCYGFWGQVAVWGRVWLWCYWGHWCGVWCTQCAASGVKSWSHQLLSLLACLWLYSWVRLVWRGNLLLVSWLLISTQK